MDRQTQLKRIRTLARWLDAKYKIGPLAVGWDAVIGLVPGVGDSISSFLGSYILVQALRAGIPTPVIARMVFNLAIETVLGSIPFHGDVFDIFWKANMRNAELFERSLADVGETKVRSVAWLAMWAILIIVLLAALIAIPVLLLSWILE